MYTIKADVQVQRRRRMCFVFDEHDQLRWSGKTVSGALKYLEEQDQVRFRLEGPGPDENFIIELIAGMVLARHHG